MYDEKYALNFPNSHYLSNLNNLNGTNQTIHLNRLPTLGEILANKSKSPVDLFTFYQFMKDVEGKVDYLDFWFDLINHLNLCKHYVKGLRDSIIRQSSTFHHNQPATQQTPQVEGHQIINLSHQQHNLQHLLSQFGDLSFESPITPAGFRDSHPLSERSKHRSLSSSILLDLIINDNILEENDSHRLSAFLRGDINLDNLDPKLKDLIEQYNAEIEANSKHSSHLGSQARSSPSYLSNPRASSGLPHAQHQDRTGSNHSFLDDTEHPDFEYENQLDIGQADRAVSASKYISLHSGGQNDQGEHFHQPPNPFSDGMTSQQKKRASTINPNLLERLIKDSPASNNGTRSFITRDNLRESSHQLLLKYFVEDSEKNLNLPTNINSHIIKAIEVDGRDDPDVFNYVKNYVFNRLENDYLPKFLDFMATRNINHSNFWRIIFGFFFLFVGFWVSFILVFLDYRKGLRPVIVVPYLFAFYFLISSIYLIDPIMAWLGISETFSKSNGRRVMKIREKFIYRFIVKRSLWVLFLILVFTAIFTVLFSLVPGHRL
ncbi:Bud site selection protein RAX1 [Candida viswanathii]|uniref:Bud site selection protein RAX1 n=1 Tax=Candida viswanathii TaxID=5486 RepID=A0A367XVK6_9ASCO|nr:Bud site selection protein RAX1 [Candida viswanathii]